MYRYHPRKSPDPEMWLALDEQERIRLVEIFHRTERVKLPNIMVHSVLHQIVETQIAENHDPVVRAMARLASESLSRHECVHAVAWVLAAEVFVAKPTSETDGETAVQQRYDSAIERLSAASWRAQAASAED